MSLVILPLQVIRTVHTSCLLYTSVEFLLPKPSYTIDTLRYLAENHGADMEFSSLMGANQIERLDGWKEYDRILEYPVYVYPRRGERCV